MTKFFFTLTRLRVTCLMGLTVVLLIVSQWKVLWNRADIDDARSGLFIDETLSTVKPRTGLTSEPTRSRIKFLLIVAYFRSGSSFTSEIFSNHEKCFYVFEPLYHIWDERSTYVTYLNGTKRYLKTDADRLTESLKEIQNWFQCNIEQIAIESLSHASFLDRNVKAQSFSICVRSKAKKDAKKDAVKKCIIHLKRACVDSTIRLIKTIRVNVIVFEKMLKVNMNMQLLHLVRDPRGIIYSRKAAGQMPEELVITAIKLCIDMEEDLESTSSLQKLYPHRVKVIRYETVAMDPVNEARRLYEYIGVTPAFADLARVYCNAFSGRKRQFTYGTTRYNSSLVAYNWFNKATNKFVRIIDKSCADLYKKLGYFAIDSEQHVSTGALFEKNILILNP